MTEFSKGITNLDGIVSDCGSGFFVSGAWQGELFHINEMGTKRLLLDLGSDKTIIADIEYIVDKKLVIIPTLYKTLLAYKWE